MPFPKGGGGGIDQLTGDVLAGPGTGAQSSALAAVGTAGTVGDASHYPVVTTDAKGRVTSMTATAVPAGVSPATTVTGPDAYGAAATVGVGTLYARNDHGHGLPAAPAASLTSAQSIIAANVSLPGTAAMTLVTSLSLAAGTWLLSAQILVSSSGSTPVQCLLGPTSASSTGAYATTETTFPSTSVTLTLNNSVIVTLASATTVYLNASSGTVVATVYTPDSLLLAVKLA